LKLVISDGEIKTLTISGRPITELDEFSVITTGYLWENLFTYLGIYPFPEKRPHIYLPNINLRDILIEAVEKQKLISTPLDDRWVVE